MQFKIRRYNRTVADWNEITLFQIIPCLNVGIIYDMMRNERRFNIAVGWMFWIAEWSFNKSN